MIEVDLVLEAHLLAVRVPHWHSLCRHSLADGVLDGIFARRHAKIEISYHAADALAMVNLRLGVLVG